MTGNRRQGDKFVANMKGTQTWRKRGKVVKRIKVSYIHGEVPMMNIIIMACKQVLKTKIKNKNQVDINPNYIINQDVNFNLQVKCYGKTQSNGRELKGYSGKHPFIVKEDIIEKQKSKDM